MFAALSHHFFDSLTNKNISKAFYERERETISTLISKPDDDSRKLFL